VICFASQNVKEKKVVEAARLQPPFVLLNAFCQKAKSYLNILRKQNISHLPKGQIFHTAKPYFTEKTPLAFSLDKALRLM
jgi:hypothetical protein